MNRSITKFDALFLIEILVGFILNHYFSHLSITVFLLLTLIGLLFEILTHSSWTYTMEFRQSFFTIQGTDISVSAAFSWAGVLTICINLSALVAGFLDFPYKYSVSAIVITGIIGNSLETICNRWGMFTYEESWLTKMFIFKKSIFLWGVPLMVRIGYFIIFGVLCASIVHWQKSL